MQICNIIKSIENLIDETPRIVYDKIYEIRGINTSVKSSIIIACLNDSRDFALKGVDTCSRNVKLQKAINSLKKLQEKNDHKSNK